jgi:hypothetical protein
MTNGTATVLIPAANAFYSIAVDSLGRLLVSFLPSAGNQRLQLHNANGALVTNNFATAMPRSPLALGPGGDWGNGVYFVSTNGALMSVDVNGAATQRGTGFAEFEDLVFGPDGALYCSDIESDCVLRIGAPVVAVPSLQIARTATNTVVVSWPLPSTGWNLQQNLQVGTTNWATPPQSVSDDGTNRLIIINPPTGNQFYRLHKP